MLRQVHGWSFPDTDRLMAAELLPDGTYQAANLRAALEYVTNWSLAIDAGAHVGTWSRLLSAVFARVIAIEPSPDTCEALTVNMRRFECANVDVRQIALGKGHGAVSMRLDPKELARGNTGGRYVQAGGSIPCETIDEWKLLSLGFLKLDIEGSEVAALEGAALTLQRCHPVVLFESKNLWKRYGYAPGAPQAFLTSLGYRSAVKVGSDEIWTVAA